MEVPRSQWGEVRGFVRYASGQPAGHCAVWEEPTGEPRDKGRRTSADGSYLLRLPPATYTIKVNGLSSSRKSLTGEAAGVVVTARSDIIVDITVTEDQD